MAVELTMSMGPHKHGSILLNRFTRQLPQQLLRGLTGAGRILKKEMINKVGGPGFTRNPARSSPYPGIGATGIMRGSIFFRVEGHGSSLLMRTGPLLQAAPYTIFHVLGTKNMPKRDFVGDTMKDTGKEALTFLSKSILAPLRKK